MMTVDCFGCLIFEGGTGAKVMIRYPGAPTNNLEEGGWMKTEFVSIITGVTCYASISFSFTVQTYPVDGFSVKFT